MNTPLAEVIGLLKLSEAAAPGEWLAAPEGEESPLSDAIWTEHECENGGDIICLEPLTGGYSESQKYWPANAAFIVALVNWFRENYASMRDEGRDALLIECYRWLFGDLSDGPRVSEGAIEKGWYTPEFRELHDRLFASLPLTAPGEGGAG